MTNIEPGDTYSDDHHKHMILGPALIVLGVLGILRGSGLQEVVPFLSWMPATRPDESAIGVALFYLGNHLRGWA